MFEALRYIEEVDLDPFLQEEGTTKKRLQDAVKMLLDVQSEAANVIDDIRGALLADAMMQHGLIEPNDTQEEPPAVEAPPTRSTMGDD